MKIYLILLPIMFIGLGCAASYNVGVNGYSSTGQSVSIPDESSFAVVTDRDVPNPIFQKEVGTKIRKILTDMGYVGNVEQPDYYLLFDYGIDSGRSVTDAIPIYHRGYYYEHGFPSFHRHGYTTYIPYSSVIYTRWLVLKLFEGKAYAESKQAEPLWICEVASAGVSSDLRETINYLLVAAFEHLGQDTGRQISEVVLRDDERVRALAEY
ncbi:MAG: hypothetical protein JSW47_18535 [Phycisphaerales bacterium]|nr:MAG: hypothetical protein JSW47_18535 [Phycisphaerales bacterium]